jgi:hypothetical protein
MNDESTGVSHWSFWLIGGVTLIYNALGVMNYFTQINAQSVAAMPEMYRALIEGRPAWATGAFAVAVFGATLGCVVLLLKRSAAYYLFIASLIGALVTMIHTLGMTGSDVGPVGSLIGNLLQLVVTAFLIWYSRYAKTRTWIK